MNARTAGARPRLLAVLVSLIALALLLPWLSDLQWRGEGVTVVSAVLEGRPLAQPERVGYLILGIAADGLLPSSATRDLNILGLTAAVLAALAVGRLRSALTRGGAPLDRLLEPLVTATALMAAGPFLIRALSADPAPVEVFLAGTAAALAWTGRFPTGMAVFGLLLFVSSRALLALPILLAAPRPRGDLRAGALALAPWLLYALIFRPGLHPAADPVSPRDGLGEALTLAVGLGGLVVLAGFGGVVGLYRGGLNRRFVLALLVTMALHVSFLVPRAGWVESAVPLTPWWAVLAGSGVGALRRAAMRVARVPLGPAAAALGLAILMLNLVLSLGCVAEPVWRRARTYRELCRELKQVLVTPHRLAGTWDDLALFELATDFQARAWTPIPGPPLSPGPLNAEERLALDTAIARGSVLLNRRLRFGVVLTQDSLGTSQILAKGGHQPKRSERSGQDSPGLDKPPIEEPLIAVFGQKLVLERVEIVTPPRSGPGGLATVHLHWRADWDPGELPAAAAGREGAVRALRVATSVVDAGGRIGQDLTHWLGFGLVDLEELGGRRVNESIVFRLPSEFGPGDYGVEVAVYEPLAGDSAALDLDLGFFRQRRYAVRTGGIPPGVTPNSVRAISFRLPAAAFAP